ncbi:MAG: SRPBCC family protein [Candidatus Rokubacteria bacterium]|nr:SRPBCC family protein [Candidatus Rokubacteria bacterium]
MKRSLPIAAVLVLLAWTPAASTLAMSEEQRRRLEGGDVVVLDILPPGHQAAAAQGGTAFSLVNAPPEAVWQLVIDYPRHVGLYPKVTMAEVLEVGDDHALVRYVVGVGLFSFRFHVDNYPDAGRRRLAWQLAAGRSNGLFRANWGYWHVEPHGAATMLTYSIAARTVLPAFLTRGAEREGLVDTIKAVRDRAEGRS